MNLLAEDRTVGENLRVATCWVVGLSLIFFGFGDLESIGGKGGITGAFGDALIGMAKGVLGAIFLAPSLANIAAKPFLRLVDSIYLPGGHADKPPLDYKMASYYRRTRQFDLAIERYEEIVRYYPNEVDARAWLFVLVARETGDRGKAYRVLRTAKRRLSRNGLWEAFRKCVVTAKAELG